MYSLEDVLSWEAEMSDALDKDREKLLMYRFMERDLKHRRQVFLLEDNDNPAALQQMEEVIGRLRSAISETERSMEQKSGSVQKMYEQWTNLLNQKSGTVY